jgi:hypothetical protein
MAYGGILDPSPKRWRSSCPGGGRVSVSSARILPVLLLALIAASALWSAFRVREPVITYDFTAPENADTCSSNARGALLTSAGRPQPPSSPSLPRPAQQIPNIVHYVFGLKRDFGGKPFGFAHFLSVLAAKKWLQAERIMFYYQHEPDTVWYKRALAYMTPVKLTDPHLDTIYGIKMANPAHIADVLRLKTLQKYGGIYLDMDVIPLRPFTPLLHNDMVLGYEGWSKWGLCNAVIIAKPNSPFIAKWLATYATFTNDEWGLHSVITPMRLASEHKDELCTLPPHSLFWPTWEDRHIAYMFGRISPSEAQNFERSLVTYGLSPERRQHGLPDEFRVLHEGQFAYHMWELASWKKHLRNLTPWQLLEGRSRFAVLTRELLRGEPWLREDGEE